jgi:major membrane immunogen (membrane-anchored lipoprotein)
MKKLVMALTLIALVFATVSVSAQVKAKDGFYFAEQTEFSNSGWKYQAVIEVKGGKIVSANWNAVNRLGAPDKKTHAAAGNYGMAKVAKQGEWDVQAQRVEAELIKVQDPAKIALKADGKTDAISGVSVTVKEFIDLAVKALASDPIAKGSYKKDGWFFFKSSTFAGGYAPTALITVVNGRIVSAVWDEVSQKAGTKTKLGQGKDYGMAKVAKQGEWFVQAERVQAELIKQQDPAKIKLKADGKTDAISGVSVTINSFIGAATEALKAAK